jgi:hypothetical protein
MAYREQHERKCPTCGEWMSATAPKCLNCGEYIGDDDEDDADEEENGRPQIPLKLIAGVVAALVAVGVVIYLLVRQRL